MSLQNVVLFGAGGSNIGHHLLQAFVKDSSFNVTVLARNSSKTEFPNSTRVIRVPDDFPHHDVVQALKEQDVVISASGFTANSIQYKLVDAAIEAGVKKFIPSEWGMDNSDPRNQDLCPVFKMKAEFAEYLHSKESDAFGWTAVASSIWLDWSLDVTFLGINPTVHTAEYWCGGTHTPSVTTLPYCAQATLQILKHPDLFKNTRVFLSPFQASQREIVAELESMQGIKYQVKDAPSDAIVEDAQLRWHTKGDVMAAYTLVSAGVLLPGYGADFLSSKKVPILEQMVQMPELSLAGVIEKWAAEHPKTFADSNIAGAN